MDITVRWAGASDAAAGSTYKVERSVDFTSWTQLAAAQAATSGYVTKQSTLVGNTAWGATSIVLTSGTAFSSSGYGSVGDAYFSWTGKTTDTLTGVVWVLGSGTYAAGTVVRELHESYADTGVTVTNLAVVYRITHKLANVEAAPDYIWFYSPGTPASSEHCRVLVGVFADLGIDPLADVTVTCHLAAEGDFTSVGNAYVDPETAAGNTQTTNALGLAVFDCWHSASRFASGGGSAAAYTFTIGTSAPFTVEIASIEARAFMFLGQLVS